MSDYQPDQPAGPGDVCAVIVTYHPDGGFPERLRRLLAHVGHTVVVDNGSTEAETGMLRESCLAGATLICNAANLGIAHALNVGVQRALALGHSWALLLDQDSAVDSNMVERLLQVQVSCLTDHVAAIGARFRDTHGRPDESIRLAARGALWEEVESVITSGCLLSLRAYRVIGPFRDEFFIDHVDTEYCFRARAAGYRVIESLTPLMSHTVGAPTSHKLFGRTVWTTNHSAERRYYIARNNTVMLREYGTSGRSSWQWKSIVRCFRLCRRIAYFEDDKLRKIAAVGQGWFDAMRGRMGPRRRPERDSAKRIS
jgi:rhamnosyltransferase